MSIRKAVLHAVLKFWKNPRHACHRIMLYACLYCIGVWRRRSLRRRSVVFSFYPNMPRRPAAIWKIMQWLGASMVSGQSGIKCAWHDTTLREPLDIVGESINYRCADIRKKTVGEKFKQVFGYALEIDPKEYHGVAVKKSNLNSRHDGKSINCPINSRDVDPESCYQMFIDSQVNGEVIEYRTPIVGDLIPLVYRRRRPLACRFDGSKDRVIEVMRSDDVFSKNEKKNIIKLARKLNADYAEMDILRHSDGKIYVVDVNNTPSGPLVNLGWRQSLQAVRIMAKAFQQQFVEVKYSGWYENERRSDVRNETCAS